MEDGLVLVEYGEDRVAEWGRQYLYEKQERGRGEVVAGAFLQFGFPFCVPACAERMEFDRFWAKFISGLFAAAATAISVHESSMHLKYFYRPEMQVRIIRILGMVPIYSITSWLSLCSTSDGQRLGLGFARDCYEAFVIYSFVSLLIRLGGGWRRTIFYLEDQPRASHFFPLNHCLPPVKLDQKFLIMARAAALQFVIVKPLNGLLILMAHTRPKVFGILSEQTVTTIVAITNNISISAALYSLVMLHTALEELLHQYHPLPKFLAVKMVVFFSFWQGVVLNILVRFGIIRDFPDFTVSDQVTGIQDMLICFEMVLAAICHTYVFSWKEWRPIDGPLEDPDQKPIFTRLLKVADVRDYLTDWRDTLSGDGYEYELRQNEPMAMAKSAMYS